MAVLVSPEVNNNLLYFFDIQDQIVYIAPVHKLSHLLSIDLFVVILLATTGVDFSAWKSET